MAGASKKHAQAGKQPQGSSQGSSSASRDPTQRSTKSIPRLDGNRDPSVLVPVDYTRPTDLKNISEFLGIGGWYAARGVSTNTLLSQPAYACTFPNKHSQLLHLRMQTGFSALFREAETLDACKKNPCRFSSCPSLITILSFSITSHISNILPLYIICTIHYLLFHHHDFLRSPDVPGRLLLSTPTCEHRY
jgi:hypothetical protein